MYKTPTQEFVDLSARLYTFEPKLAVKKQGLGHSLTTWNPATRATIELLRETDGDYLAEWYPKKMKEPRGWFTSSPEGDSSAVPSKLFLTDLTGALPVPLNWIWGVAENGRVVEAMIFVRPAPITAYTVWVEGHQPQNQDLQVSDNTINLKRFWDRVRAGKLVNVAPQLKKASTVQFSYMVDLSCIIVGDQPMFTQSGWARKERPTLAQLQRVAVDLKPRLR